jgi:D-amino-acid dehydrogenase
LDFDIVVLGAGIVGVSAALQLQARNRSVCIVERNEPGGGTSFGNAGLIERSSVIPYAFPRSAGRLLRYALNGEPDVRYEPSFLPRIAGWLVRYWHQSSPANLRKATAAMLPLVERCVEEHDALVARAKLESLIGSRGWIEVYRDPEALKAGQRDARALEGYGLDFDLLDAQALRALEPGLKRTAAGGVRWKDPKTVRDPGALVKGYAALFERDGGHIVRGDARTLKRDGTCWLVQTEEGAVRAKDVIVALGADSADVYAPLGYRVPLAVKRGYHLHYRAREGTAPRHPLCDVTGGYVLAPMNAGIRLTTGIEFARPGAPANRVQLRRAEAIARDLFDLGDPIDAEPWLGRRPCLPDMCPVVGPAPHHPGLWFDFGHAHHGLTLGPVTGRLIADLVTGAKPFTDPAPYSVTRFS